MVDNPRYPNMVCTACQVFITDENNRQIEFFNESISGGIIGIYKITGEPYNSTQCFINNIKCEAKEGRFGGIVIEKTI
jgi:hypothetical protein